MRARLLAVGVALLATLGLAFHVNAAETESRAFLAVHSTGMDGMMPSEKDTALRNALHMLSARLMELPEELDEPGMPAPLIAMAIEMLMSPMDLQANVPVEVEEDGAPIELQLLIQAPDRQAAEHRTRMLMQVLRQAPVKPVGQMQRGEQGMMQSYDLEGVPLHLGLTMDDGGAPSTILLLNRDEPMESAPKWITLPGGAEPAIAMHIDLAAMQPILDMMEEEAPPEQARMMRQQLEMWGVSREHPMTISMAHGFTDGAGVGALRIDNYMNNPAYAAMVMDQPVDSAWLDLIPADATMFELWRADYSGLMDVMRQWMEPLAQMQGGGDMDDPVAMINEFLGVDIERDVLDNLGTNFGYYMSDTTGGGGLASLVMFSDLENPEAFEAAMDTVADSLNQKAQGMARGYVRIQKREVNGRMITSLLFPGLPIPLEPCWTVENGRKWFAATPQALLAALDQAESGGESIRSNPRFRAAARHLEPSGVVIQFQDTPVLAARGYGLLNFGLAAVSNMLRSPNDAQRDPGLLMPGRSELVDGAQASLMVSRIEGDALVAEWRSDESMLVNVAALTGTLTSSAGPLAMAGLGAGVMLPAIGKAREQAKSVKSMTQLRQIGMAIHTYAHEQNGEIPTSLQQLVEAGYITEEMLTSPFGPSWAEDDFWINPNPPKRMSMIRHPAELMAAYDQAMYFNQDMVAVLFYDGHAELRNSWEIDMLIQEAQQAAPEEPEPIR